MALPDPKTSRVTEFGGSGLVLPDGWTVSGDTADAMLDAYQKACDAGLYIESAEGLAEWIDNQHTLGAEEVTI